MPESQFFKQVDPYNCQLAFVLHPHLCSLPFQKILLQSFTYLVNCSGCALCGIFSVIRVRTAKLIKTYLGVKILSDYLSYQFKYCIRPFIIVGSLCASLSVLSTCSVTNFYKSRLSHQTHLLHCNPSVAFRLLSVNVGFLPLESICCTFASDLCYAP